MVGNAKWTKSEKARAGRTPVQVGMVAAGTRLMVGDQDVGKGRQSVPVRQVAPHVLRVRERRVKEWRGVGQRPGPGHTQWQPPGGVSEMSEHTSTAQ